MNKKCAVISPASPPPYIEEICKKLAGKGFAVDRLDWRSIDDIVTLEDGGLSPVQCPLILIAKASDCPAFLPNIMLEYLKNGGRLITLGGPPFENEFYSVNNSEVDKRKLSSIFAEGGFDKTVIFPFDSLDELKGFSLDTSNPDSKKLEQTARLSILDGGVTSGKCLSYKTESFYINESFEKAITIPSGHNVLGFFAAADEHTKKITIELLEENGRIFKGFITPQRNFSFFMLSASDFIYSGNHKMKDHPIEGRLTKINWGAVCKIRIGHALSHAYSVAGKHEFFIDELSSGHIGFLNEEKITIDGIYPPYKFYPVTNAASVSGYKNQAVLSQRDYTLPRSFFSLSKRPQSTGIDKARRFRFIPLIEAFDEKGLSCGYAAYMFINYAYGDKLSNVDGSAYAAFTTEDDSFYQNGGDDAVAETAEALTAPAFLLEGGADEYIYMKSDTARNARYGAVMLIDEAENATAEIASHTYRLKITVDNVSRIYAPDELLTVKQQGRFAFKCITLEQPPTSGTVTVALMRGEEVCDILTHEVSIYEEKDEEKRHYAKIMPSTNEVFIGDSMVRFFGVNYMPSSNAGIETYEEFEHYVASFAYDPEVIEADLKRIAEISMNAVSIFFHYEPSIHSNNILHLISLCEKYGLYVNLSIRPHANPFDFNPDEVREMITRYGLDKNDTIVGYDIAWERYVGTYEPCYGNFSGRKSFDEGFRRFLLENYGSYENAQSKLCFDLPLNGEGEVVGPSDDMLRGDGAHTDFVSVYRRYIDNAVSKAYISACDYIRSIDKNHLITARSGDASTIPLVDPGIYGYDFKATTLALDFTAPESYALSDDIKSIRQGAFTNIYSRYADKNTVVQWLEFGKSIWTGSNFTDNSVSLEFQANYYREFYDMLLAGHTNGSFAWWWAGGYRVGENSDFGIVSPDGSDRPVTAVIREYSKKFINAPTLPKPSCILKIDRDKHSDGLKSVYLDVESPLFSAISEGKAVGFTDVAEGKSTADAPLDMLGGVIPKYLDSILTSCTAILDDGSRITVKNGDSIDTKRSKAVTISMELINPLYSKWLCGDFEGCVSLVSLDDEADGSIKSDYRFSLSIVSDVSYKERVSFYTTVGCEGKGLFSCRLSAKNRCMFGEVIRIFIA